MNKKFLLLTGALVLSFATVSFAASPPPPENDAMSRQGADFHDEKPAKPDPKVQTTDGKTHPGGSGGVKKDDIGDPGADFRDEKPGTPDPKVQTTTGKTYPATTGVENDKIGGGK